MADSDRRGFLTRIAAGAAVAGAGLGASRAARAEDTPQVQRRTLGATGVSVSILGCGLGSAFTGAFKDDPELRDATLQRALDLGVNYWDTANGYGESQKMMGPDGREETRRDLPRLQTGQRTYDGYMRELVQDAQGVPHRSPRFFHCHNLGGGKNNLEVTGGVKAWKRLHKAARRQGAGHHQALGLQRPHHARCWSTREAYKPECL